MLLQIPKENRQELKAVLDALILEGKAEVTSKGKYRRATAKTVTGVFTAHPRGFEFKPTYPFRPDKEIKKIQLAMSIYTLAAIIAEAILVIIDFHVGDRIGWSIMTGACMVYAYITLKFSIQKHNGYQFKILMQTLLGVAVVVLIDFLTGFSGWSVNYVLPAAFVLIDATVIVLMIVNSRNWQSYIPMQLLLIVLCIIPYILHHFGISSDSIMCLIALCVAIFVFAGSVIIGGRRAMDELYRRFHV